MTEAALRALFTTGPARLSDADWSRIEHLFPTGSPGRGRPRADARQILDAVLWACFDDHEWSTCQPRIPRSRPATSLSSNGDVLAC